MTITADWRWWTYFVVGADVVSRGRVVDYDLAARRLRYDVAEPGGWRTVEAPFDHVWVDPARQLVLPHAQHEALRRAELPPGFVELVGEDPRAYFAGARVGVSTYLPADDDR